MSTHAGRTGRNIRDPAVFQAFQDLIFQGIDPENIYLRHRMQMIETIEDEGERAPPLSELFDTEVKGIHASEERCNINVTEFLNYRPYFFLRR